MHTHMRRFLIPVFVLLVLAAGCAQRAAEPPMSAPAADRDLGARPQAEAVSSAPQAGNEALQPTGERMIIRTVDLGLQVADTQAAADQVKAIAESFEGYVAGSNLYRAEDGLLRGTITIRVPASDVDTALERIKALATRVEREQESSQDVGEEYTDLTARRRNLEATERELLALLTQVREQGGKAEDILAVYRELTNIRSQIEQIQGRMQYLERLTALATINAELIPAEAARPLTEPNWAPTGTVREASRALVRTFQGLVSLAIWLLIVVLPVLLLVLLPLAAIVWLVRRWRRGKSGPTAPSQTTPL